MKLHDWRAAYDRLPPGYGGRLQPGSEERQAVAAASPPALAHEAGSPRTGAPRRPQPGAVAARPERIVGYAARSSCRLSQGRGGSCRQRSSRDGGTTTTGQTACSTAAWLTDPSSSSEKPPRPRDPTTS